MAYNVDCTVDFGAANTGLTVHGKLQDMTGTQVGSTVTTGIVESAVALGQYLYTLSAPDGHRGSFVMYNSANDALRRTVAVSPADTELTAIADAVLGRSVAYVEDTAGVYTIAGLILAAFESSAPGTTWTIKKTDGTTTFATRTLTEDANANPVTGVS